MTQNITTPMARSTNYLSISEQRDTLSAQSAHSVVNIMWLNETLPPFMTRDFMLAPFGPPSDGPLATAETWTGFTQLFSVNTTCETPIPWIDTLNRTRVNSTWGCSIPSPPAQISGTTGDGSKIFNALYFGWSNDDGSADHYLNDGQSCPRNESRTFLIQWSKALASNSELSAMTSEEQQAHFNVTNRWCRSNYYMQDVEAVITLPEKHVLSYRPRSAPRSLPVDMFNISDFEAAMNMGHERSTSRTDFPTIKWPDQESFLLNYPLNTAYLPKMAPFAIGVSQKSPDEYLQPATLDASYQSAYRLLFSRQMVNILSTEPNSSTTLTGQRQFTTQAIFLVSAFTYLAEAFLGLTVILACWLLSFSKRVSRLRSDPSTISAMMSLTADNESLLGSFKSLDQKSNTDLEKIFASRRFRISQDGLDRANQLVLDQISSDSTSVMEIPEYNSFSRQNSTEENIIRGVQPLEFKNKTGLAFFSLQIALLVVISVFFIFITMQNGRSLNSCF